jgi:cytochrome c oxidase assembly protein subunit 15
MGIDVPARETPVSPRLLWRWVDWARSTSALRRLAIASVVANVIIVVTGGAVRLSGSGLGCPTWPDCTDHSLVRTPETGVHGIIEFTNRQLTFVLTVVAVATLVVAWTQHRQTKLAALAFLGIPVQAVVGGISVLTHLNPWVVALHFLTSMAMIAVTFLLWARVADQPLIRVPDPARWLARVSVAVTGAVLAFGTIVTGSGPHSGAHNASQRTGLKVSSITQLHADAVMVLLGVTVGLIAVLAAVKAPSLVMKAVWVLLGVELAQGIIGYAQYFLHVPAVLVGFHMFGACLVWLAMLRVVFLIEPRMMRGSMLTLIGTAG